MTTTDVPPLRQNRDFLLLWTGAALSSLGSNASSVAYPLLVLGLTGSAVDAGLVGFVALLPQLFFPLVAGALADRWDRKRVMITADVLRLLGLASIVVALVAGTLTLAQVLVVGFLEGALSVAYKVSAGAAVPNVVHPSHLTLAVSRNEARERGAAMLGQPLGGALYGLGRAVPFAVDAVSYLASLVTLVLIRRDFQSVTATRPASLRSGLGAGAVWLWRQPFLRAATLLVAGSNFLFRALFLVVIVLAGQYGAGPSDIGLLFGVAAAGGVVGSLVAPAVRTRVSLKAVVIGANWAWAALVPLVLAVRDPLMVGAVYALMCFVGPLWNIAISTYQLTVTPDHLRGRVLGAAGFIAFGAIPLGSLAGGLLLQWIGAVATVWGLAAWMLVLAVLATVSPAVRAAPADPTADDPTADGEAPGAPVEPETARG